VINEGEMKCGPKIFRLCIPAAREIGNPQIHSAVALWSDCDFEFVTVTGRPTYENSFFLSAAAAAEAADDDDDERRSEKRKRGRIFST